MALSITSIFDSLYSGLRKTAILSIWLPIYLYISLAYAHTIYIMSYGYALLYPLSSILSLSPLCSHIQLPHLWTARL